MPAATDLTTIANYKQWGGVTGTTDDALLGRLITSASLFILQNLNDNILSQSYTERRDGWGGHEMPLRHGPVTAIASVTVNGVSIPASADGIASGFVPALNGVELTGYRFNRGRGNVFITYTAGYAAIPGDVEQACIELVELRYKQRGRSDVTSKTLQGEQISYKLDAMTDSIMQALDNYKRVAPV